MAMTAAPTEHTTIFFRRDELEATNTFSDAFLEWIKSAKGAKELAKMFKYAGGVFSEMHAPVPESAKRFFSSVGLIKDFLGGAELLHKWVPLREIDLFNSSKPKLERLRTLFENGSNFIGAATDAFAFASAFVLFNGSLVLAVEVIGCAALAAGSASGFAKSLENIGGLPTLDASATFYHLVNAIHNFAYLAVGIAGLAVVCGTGVPSSFFLLCSITTLVASMTAFFYKKVYDPEHKGMNVPVTVLDTTVRQQIEKQMQKTSAVST
jgi:hypothetical protein